MTNHTSRRLPRILTTLAIAGAAAGLPIATAGAAVAADTLCPAVNPDTGFSDPTCGPFHFTSSGYGGTYSNPRIGDVTAQAHSQWGGFLGTYYEDSRANLYRSGVDAAAPYVQTTVTFYSSALSGFHGCVQTWGYDALGGTRYDSGVQRVGVDSGSSYTLTFGSYLTPAAANSITSLSVAQWKC